MKKNLYILLALACLCGTLSAQRKFEYRVKAGFNVGGALPIPFPAEIRKIKSYNPTMAFSIEGNIMRRFTDKWALLSGIRLETKGMSTKARVKNYAMTMNVSVGDEPGRSRRVHRHGQYESPQRVCHAARAGAPRAVSALGPESRSLFLRLIEGGFDGTAYDGYMREGNPVGTKVGVEAASYDFSSDVRTFNWGGEIGAEFAAYRHLTVYADLTWAFNSLFPKDFKSIGFPMYNVYLNIGFGYVLLARTVRRTARLSGQKIRRRLTNVRRPPVFIRRVWTSLRIARLSVR